jgi:cytidine deaminase
MSADLASGMAVGLLRMVDACRQTLLASDYELVKVATAVLCADGRIFTALQVRSRSCNHCSVCAEAIAIGMALTAGHHDLVACVALVRTGDGTPVYSPCGSCRELLRDHGVTRVVAAESPAAQPITATLPELLPWP